MASSAVLSSCVNDTQDSETHTFFRLLTHDDRGSYYGVASRNASGIWCESFVKTSQLMEFSIFDSSADWYLTRNGFSMKCRKTERTRQINALMFDLDAHEGAARDAVTHGISTLNTAVSTGILPEPSLLVDSGRGLHIYYILEHSTSYRLSGGSLNSAGLSFFKDVEALLAKTIDHVFAQSELQLDAAVYDYSRVSRIPGTYNTKAGCFARLLHYREAFYTLSSLKDFCLLTAETGVQARSRKTPSTGRMVNFDKLSLSRVGKIRQLQQLRQGKCHGDRELMSFCFYNAAVQVFSDKIQAKSELFSFNQGFTDPLPDSVLNEIVSSVSKVGFYKMSASKIVDFLKMTSAEIESVRFFESARKTAREQAKRQTAEKRALRNAQICALYAMPDATFESVAQAVGVCRRTVATVLKEARQHVVSPDKSVMISLKDAARKALNSFLNKECNFLADDFMSCVGFPLEFFKLGLGLPFSDLISFDFLDVGA